MGVQGNAISPQEGETLDSICGIRVLQKRAGFRFAVDAVVLADFVARDPASGEPRRLGRVADLCTGCGVIGLLLARRGAEHVLAVDIQPEMAELARRNVALNALEARMEVVRGDVRRAARELPAESFDVVVTNPPFHPANQRISPDHGRAVATHELECTLGEVVAAARWLMKPGGRFHVIYPAERTAELVDASRPLGLAVCAMRPVYPQPGRNAHALMWEFVNGPSAAHVLPPLCLREPDGRDTPELARILVGP